MVRVRGSLDIARPVEEVFDFVADQRNEVRYNPAMTDSVKITDGRSGWGHGSTRPFFAEANHSR